jgi:hypothetical protein
MYIVTPLRYAKLSTTITILNAVSVEIANQKNSGKKGDTEGYQGNELNRLYRANMYAIACAFGLENESRNQDLKADFDALISSWDNPENLGIKQIRDHYQKNSGNPNDHY